MSKSPKFHTVLGARERRGAIFKALSSDVVTLKTAKVQKVTAWVLATLTTLTQLDLSDQIIYIARALYYPQVTTSTNKLKIYSKQHQISTPPGELHMLVMIRDYLPPLWRTGFKSVGFVLALAGGVGVGKCKYVEDEVPVMGGGRQVAVAVMI